MARLDSHPLIAREGWPFLAIAVVASMAAVLLFGWGWSLPFWVVTLFVLGFFRDPAREIPEDPRGVLAPADGRIVAVERSLGSRVDFHVPPVAEASASLGEKVTAGVSIIARLAPHA